MGFTFFHFQGSYKHNFILSGTSLGVQCFQSCLEGVATQRCSEWCSNDIPEYDSSRREHSSTVEPPISENNFCFETIKYHLWCHGSTLYELLAFFQVDEAMITFKVVRGP